MSASRNIKYPLRTKRKAETHRKIAEAAQGLFFSKGYEATTLDEVADVAGVHVQTLYRHFSTKQELASSGDQRWFDHFKARLTDPNRSGNTFDFWRRWIGKSFRYLTQDGDERYRQYIRTRHANPPILGYLSTIRADYEDVLCQSLARDFGMPADGVGEPRLAAGMLIAGSSYVMRRYEVEDIDIVTEAILVIDQVEALFSHLLVERQ
ncbi:TetR/AcrR family transcriptional regulator [Henriciella sp. AS95]|uniref:TetR/AcrR family transcriptional regulator n=1 Tax=Henriciella sp. AS95 TaxID=3135782 RepID=UPI00316CF394